MKMISETDAKLSVASDEFLWNDSGRTEANEFIFPRLCDYLERIKAKTVLDLGCGNGALTGLLAAKGFHMIGCDGSTTGIEIARNQYPSIEFFVHDLMVLLPERFREMFDAVISSEVIEHLLLPRSLMKNAVHALKPGGGLIITTPFHGYWKNLALALTNHFDDHWHPLRDYGHIKFFSKKTLLTLFNEFGFINLGFTTVGRIPPLARSMIVFGLKS